MFQQLWQSLLAQECFTSSCLFMCCRVLFSHCNELLLLIGLKPCSILLTEEDVNACRRVATSSRATPADKLLCKAINKRFTDKPPRTALSGSEYSPSSTEDTCDDDDNDSDEDLSDEQHQARSSETAGKGLNLFHGIYTVRFSSRSRHGIIQCCLLVHNAALATSRATEQTAMRTRSAVKKRPALTMKKAMGRGRQPTGSGDTNAHVGVTTRAAEKREAGDISLALTDFKCCARRQAAVVSLVFVSYCC